MQTAIKHTTIAHQSTAQDVTPDLAMVRTGIANLYFYGKPGAGDREWILIDAGMPGFASRIKAAAAERFAPGARPSAIVLTHGHFDHVGALRQLADEWDVPIYAHPLELPYLTGRSFYPPPDPLVGGGVAFLSPLYPRSPIDVHDRVESLPADYSIPGMPGWRWLHTPGHAPGHIALFRDQDRVLLAGDAVVTVNQESLLAVTTQRPEMHRPPAYFTVDWPLASLSFRTLAALEPDIVASGHGVPLRGEEMRQHFRALAERFEEKAFPTRGRYVQEPAITDSDGVRSIPPVNLDPRLALLVAFSGAIALGVFANRRD